MSEQFPFELELMLEQKENAIVIDVAGAELTKKFIISIAQKGLRRGERQRDRVI